MPVSPIRFPGIDRGTLFLNVLVCAATSGELARVPERVPGTRLISGVGIPATFVQLMPLLAQLPPLTLILNVGIAGAYPETDVAIGDIVIGNSEVYGDLGMELPPDDGNGDPGFLPIAETEFGREFYATPLPLLAPERLPADAAVDEAFGIHVGRGCTVNACTGTNTVGRRRREQTGAVFETMEGAAVAQVGQLCGVPVCEIRAISNIAADRDMRPENIRVALRNLNRFLDSPFFIP